MTRRRNPNRFCECGRPATVQARGTKQRICERCAWLDGEGTTEYALIDALRRADGELDIHQIAATSGYNERSIYRMMPRLINRGRVRVRVLMEKRSEHLHNGHRRPLYRLVS